MNPYTPYICWFSVQLRPLLMAQLLLLVTIVLIIRRRIKAGSVLKQDMIAAFFLALILLLAADSVTAKFDPRGIGFLHEVRGSHTQIPDVECLVNDEGYRVDEYGIPLFESYEDYREWYCNKYPEKAYPYYYTDWRYSDDDLKQMAISYFNAGASGTQAVDCSIIYGEGDEVTLVPLSEGGAELNEYIIDREELEGRDKYFEYIYLGS